MNTHDLVNREPGIFTEAEAKANAARVVAYATETGRAVVVGADGREIMIITIPTEDLPPLDLD